MLLTHLNIILLALMNIKLVYGIIDGHILKNNPQLQARIKYIVRLALPLDKSVIERTLWYVETGICVTEWWVLTSRFIVNKAKYVNIPIHQIKVCLDHSISENYACGTPALIRYVKMFVRNPELANETFINLLERRVDLLKLNKKYGRDVIAPARLYKMHISDNMLARKIFHKCYFVGWGVKNYTEVKGVHYLQHVTDLRYADIGRVVRCPDKDKKNFFCVHEMEPVVCDGDYGGPMICDDYVIATLTLIFYSKYCSKTGQYATFEEIFLYIEWIQQTILEDKNKPNKPVSGGTSTQIKNNIAYVICTSYMVLFLLNM